MTTNIGRDNADANYRYKMPILTTKIEGRGNGIKTVITNMMEIAKALHIHPAYPTKFFGIELGAQSKYNISTERCIVNGAHMAPDLSKILDRFIQQFILCPNCKLPELKMSIKSSSIKIECAACGAASQIKSAHRLVQYMLKNPPKSFLEEAKKEGKKSKKDEDELDEESASVVAAAKAGGSSSAAAAADEADGAPAEKEKKKKEKKDKKDETPEERAARKAAKKAKKEKKEKKAKKEKKDSEEDGSSGEEDDDATESKSAEKPAAAASSSSAAPADKPSKKEKAASAVAAGDEDEDAEDDEDASEDEGDAGDDWHTDTSKAAVRKRQEAEFAEMLAGAKKDVENIVISAKADNKADSPVTILKIFLASKPRQPSEISAELRRLAMSRALDEPQKLKILLEAIIDITTPKTVVEQFKSKSELLKYFTSQSSNSAASASSPGGENRNTATTLLTCIEDLIGVVERKLLPYAPMILKTLYEEDVLEEGTLISWYDAPPEASWLVNKDVAAEVRTKAKPFIEWLRNAEEESDDE